jgi:hypothetical protein
VSLGGGLGMSGCGEGGCEIFRIGVVRLAQ